MNLGSSLSGLRTNDPGRCAFSHSVGVTGPEVQGFHRLWINFSEQPLVKQPLAGLRELIPCSAVVPNPDRDKNRGHQTTATIVVVGAEGQPNHVAEQSKSNQGEEEFVHARSCSGTQPSGGEQGCRSGCFMSGAVEAPPAGSAQSERFRL